MSDEVKPGSRECQCDWPEYCDGSAFLCCRGCGGDQCVCRCGGQMVCPGCEDCEEDWVD